MIDEDAGHPHGLRIGEAVNGPFDLGDDDPAVILRRLGDRQDFTDETLALHRQVAVPVRRRRTDEPDIHRHRLVAKPGPAIEHDALHERLDRAFVETTAAVDRINEGVETHLRENTGAFRGDLAQQHTENALRKIVGLDLVREGERPELGSEIPMASDDASHEPTMGEVIQASVASIALSRAIVEGQVPRRTVLKKAAFKGRGQQLRMPRPDKSTDRDGGTAGNGGDGFVGSGKLGFGAHERIGDRCSTLIFADLCASRPYFLPFPRRGLPAPPSVDFDGLSGDVG